MAMEHGAMNVILPNMEIVEDRMVSGISSVSFKFIRHCLDNKIYLTYQNTFLNSKHFKMKELYGLSHI